MTHGDQPEHHGFRTPRRPHRGHQEGPSRTPRPVAGRRARGRSSRRRGRPPDRALRGPGPPLGRVLDGDRQEHGRDPAGRAEEVRAEGVRRPRSQPGLQPLHPARPQRGHGRAQRGAGRPQPGGPPRAPAPGAAGRAGGPGGEGDHRAGRPAGRRTAGRDRRAAARRRGRPRPDPLRPRGQEGPGADLPRGPQARAQLHRHRTPAAGPAGARERRGRPQRARRHQARRGGVRGEGAGTAARKAHRNPHRGLKPQVTAIVSGACHTRSHDRPVGARSGRGRWRGRRPPRPGRAARRPGAAGARSRRGGAEPPGGDALGVAVDRRRLSASARHGGASGPVLRHRGRRDAPAGPRGAARRAALGRRGPGPPPGRPRTARSTAAGGRTGRAVPAVRTHRHPAAPDRPPRRLRRPAATARDGGTPRQDAAADRRRVGRHAGGRRDEPRRAALECRGPPPAAARPARRAVRGRGRAAPPRRAGGRGLGRVRPPGPSRSAGRCDQGLRAGRDQGEVHPPLGDPVRRPPGRRPAAGVQEAVPHLGGPRLVLAPGLGARGPVPTGVPGRGHGDRALGDPWRRRPADPQGDPAGGGRRPRLAAGGGRRRPDGAAGAGRDLPRPRTDGGRRPRERPLPGRLRPGLLRRPRPGQAGRARRRLRPDVR
ncbi:hypothetical protein SGPA1_60216 [Streptomyces misionensis JCM 4497]